MRYTTRDHFVDAAFQQTQRPFRRVVLSLTSAITDQFIDLAGDFLYIDQASTGYVTIELNTAGAGVIDPITLAAGGAIEANFANFKISAPAQLGKSVTLIVGNGARIKGGATINPTSEAITTIPGGKFISAADRAFMNYWGVGASVGNFSMAQLFNPAANTRTIYVTKVIPLNHNMAISGYSTALATLTGYAPSLKVDGVASTAQSRYEQAAGSLYTQYFGIAIANTPYLFDRPLCLTPGKGMVLAPQGTNLAAYITVEFFEE